MVVGAGVGAGMTASSWGYCCKGPLLGGLVVEFVEQAILLVGVVPSDQNSTHDPQSVHWSSFFSNFRSLATMTTTITATPAFPSRPFPQMWNITLCSDTIHGER